MEALLQIAGVCPAYPSRYVAPALCDAVGRDNRHCCCGGGAAARVGILCAALILGGCATRPAWLENRIAVTADGRQVHVLSVWGPVSIGSRVADSDARAIIEALQARRSDGLVARP